MTTEEIIEKAKQSPALEWRSKEEGSFAYPAHWEDKVPLKVQMRKSVFPDFLFLAKPGTSTTIGEEYYVWVNNYGAVSAILENGEQLGLKPDEFRVIEFHAEKPNE